MNTGEEHAIERVVRANRDALNASAHMNDNYRARQRCVASPDTGNHLGKNKIIRKAKYVTMIWLASFAAYGQEMPEIQFNHLYYTLEPMDLKAIRESSFVNDTLAACLTRTDSTATYLFGPSSYLELFQTSGNDALLGFSGIAFSVDKIGKLSTLKSILDRTYKTTTIGTRKRDLDGEKVPWFDMLGIVLDSTFHAQSRVWFWIMEYKVEYFKHNKYTISDSQLTRENYLEKYASQRANKILKRFSGVVMKLNSSEKEYITNFFESIEYKKNNENHFVTPDNFRFLIKDRLPGDRKAIESIEFETSTNFSEKKTIKLSANVFVTLDGNNGKLVFK